MGVSKRRGLSLSRDGILFIAGLAGIAHEAIVSELDRPTLLLLFGAMIGLPAFLQKDEKNQEKENDQQRPPGEHDKSPQDGQQDTPQ